MNRLATLRSLPLLVLFAILALVFITPLPALAQSPSRAIDPPGFGKPKPRSPEPAPHDQPTQQPSQKPTQQPTAQPKPSSPSPAPKPLTVPAARAAKNPYVITIKGPIDEWTAISVTRRIRQAELDGADTIVFELDTPGGEMGAMLVISTAIKKSSVKTVAWVNSNAYSAGAVIALACGEIVVSDAAALGDALPIQITQLGGLNALPDREAEKIVGPIMADIVDSARKNGRDEIMVQGFVRRGVELWLIEHSTTGQRFFVTQAQYREAVGSDPQRSTPMVPSVTGPLGKTPGSSKPAQVATPAHAAKAPAPGSTPTRYIPAAPDVSQELAEQVDTDLAVRGRSSARPDFTTPEHAGKYAPVEYVSDGYGALTFRTAELIRYQIASDRVRSDAELEQFFGSSKLTRLNESWSESFARFMSALPIKGLLVIVFLVALVIEITHPGMILPGVIAALALAALVIPPLLVNMAAWWVIAAILGGVGLIIVELFIFPGTFLAGILGVLLLFAGLMGAVLGGGLPGTGGSTTGDDALFALATLLIAFFAAGGAVWLIGRHLPSVPLFNKLILQSATDDSGESAPLENPDAEALANLPKLKPGTLGVAITPLRPAGRAQFGDHIHDVVADLGFIDHGVSIRVVSSDRFRTVVERAG